MKFLLAHKLIAACLLIAIIIGAAEFHFCKINIGSVPYSGSFVRNFHYFDLFFHDTDLHISYSYKQSRNNNQQPISEGVVFKTGYQSFKQSKGYKIFIGSVGYFFITFGIYLLSMVAYEACQLENLPKFIGSIVCGLFSEIIGGWIMMNFYPF